MPSTTTTLAAVAIGGAFGSVARYGISIGALACFPRFAPTGTLIANVLGCLLIGILMVLAQSGNVSETGRQLWVTGFLGGLTTFSTFGWQTAELFRERQPALAFFNLTSNCLLGLTAVGIGIWIALRWLE